MITLKTPISELTRVGKTTAKQMEKLDIKTAGDLLSHYPFRYDDYSKILSIKDLKAKKSGTIKAKINLIANHRSPRKKMVITEAIVSDQTDSIKVIWFNQPFLTKALKSGQQVYLAGKIDYDDYYGLQLTNPSYELYKDRSPIHTGRLVPIYSTTSNLSQKQIRFLIRQTLPVIQEIQDWLPRTIRIKYNLTSLCFALEQIHFPQNKKWLEKSIHRLKFDELFLIQVRNQLIRQKIKSRTAPLIKFKLEKTKKFVKSLPFKLTDPQRKSSWEIINDLGKNSPMNRLLEGDVGSGKTIVAVIAILNTILNHYQVAYMAPTEILAEQHFKNITELFAPLKKNSLTEFKKFRIALLTRENIKTNPAPEPRRRASSLRDKQARCGAGKSKKIKKSELLKQISLGKIDLVIGTHALIQEKIKFKNLGLAIIDEQHRFGVEQRSALIQQSTNYSPHFLSMTATPIPRSVALTLYGDLDLSIIDQLPPGRKKVITKIVGPEKIKDVYQFIRTEIKKGHQIFITCPLIDPSDKLGVKSVKEEFKKLSEKIFPDFEIALLHGKLKTNQKGKIMKDFVENKINILISTTVVEVGIDVPNASIMIIEGAERFGLAQLYQLRGRIGRSPHQSYCFLFLESKGKKAKKRLQALLTAKNGFELAEKDLQLRGPGEIFGTGQSGFLANLKIAKLSDVEIIKQAQQAGQQIFQQGLDLKEYPLLKNKIDELIQITHLE
ncbi:ATP-dependent DNA helicase RecG [Patescibacteria group bacterium]|nr:ATP-dependent DNA helicase RecG [Patescibacteria group bacterium]